MFALPPHFLLLFDKGVYFSSFFKEELEPERVFPELLKVFISACMLGQKMHLGWKSEASMGSQ